jgi:hypothetical protein
MKTKGLFQSIGGKVLGLASLITILVFTVLFLVGFFWQRKEATARITLTGRNASGMLSLAMDGTMLRGDVEEMRGVFRKARNLNQDLTLYLTDPAGVVKFSTREDRLGSTLTAEEAGAEGKATVLETVQVLRAIHEQVSRLAERLDKVKAATEQQAQATAAVDRDVFAITGRTQEVSAATEQTAATITEVSRTTADHAALAEDLSRLVGKFKL